MNVLRISALTSIALLLTACDPDYVDTANQCAAGGISAVRATYTDFSIARVAVPSDIDTTKQCAASGSEVLPEFTYVLSQNVEDLENPDVQCINNYKPYLTDIFTAMKLADGAALADDPTDPSDENYVENPLTAAEKQDVVDAVISLVAGEAGYTLENGQIKSVNNPVEFAEYLLASENPDEQIDLFQAAKNQVSQGIDDDDGYCSFNNYNIRLDKVDSDDTTVRLEEISIEPLSLYYSPFDMVQRQTVQVRHTVDPDAEEPQPTDTLSGVAFMDGAIYNNNGYTEPDISRSILASTDDGETSLSIDDKYTNKMLTTFADERDHIGFILYGKLDVACNAEEDEDGTIVYSDCEDGIETKPITKTACTGGENPLDEDWETIDLSNKFKTTSVDLGINPTNPRLQGIKRIAVETDYDAEETRIYVSKYINAVLDSDGVTVIEDPTSCETDVIRDELQEQLRLAGDDHDAIDAVPLPQYILDAYKTRLAAGDENPLELVSVRRVVDRGFEALEEFEYDEEGVLQRDENGDPIIAVYEEPTPIITFQGIALPERKTPAEE